MVAKLTRLIHKIATQLHLVAENCAICSSRSRRPAWNFWIHPRIMEWHLTKKRSHLFFRTYTYIRSAANDACIQTQTQ